MFGSKSSTTSATGGLFAKKEPSNPTGLFNKPDSGTTTAAPSTSTGGSLFGNNPTTSTTRSGGLFGNKPATSTGGGLFQSSGSSQPSGGLFSSSSQNQTQASGMASGCFGQGSAYSLGGLQNSQTDQSNRHNAEIEAALQNYAAQVDPTSLKSEFVF